MTPVFLNLTPVVFVPSKPIVYDNSYLLYEILCNADGSTDGLRISSSEPVYALDLTVNIIDVRKRPVDNVVKIYKKASKDDVDNMQDVYNLLNSLYEDLGSKSSIWGHRDIISSAWERFKEANRYNEDYFHHCNQLPIHSINGYHTHYLPDGHAWHRNATFDEVKNHNDTRVSWTLDRDGVEFMRGTEDQISDKLASIEHTILEEIPAEYRILKKRPRREDV